MGRLQNSITVGIVDKIKGDIHNLITSYPKTFSYVKYADIRLEVNETKGFLSEQGEPKATSDDYGLSIGIRVNAGDPVASGYYGISLGHSDLGNIETIIKKGINESYERAIHNSNVKAHLRVKYKELAGSIIGTQLAPIEVCCETVPAAFKIDPREVNSEEAMQYITEISKAVKDLQRIPFNQVHGETYLARELFCSSEGANIDQSFALTQGIIFVIANGKENIDMYDYTGHQRGWEILVDGIDEAPYVRYPDFMRFSLDLAKEAIELSDAPKMKTTGKKVVVVTDPHYNTLKVHEIVGHPSELDRALKKETGYAGRSWLLRDMQNTQINERIGSILVNAYSDPSLPGYGHYKYDHEGTPAKKVVHIENGIFKGFMNSRETAAVLGVEPNGSFKATDAALVPIIRMSNTVFGQGDTNPEDIIAEVDHGYYLVGHRIPSISESRENFRISARKTYEIKDGKLGQLFRDGGIMADTYDYLMNIDAVGNDFTLYPIPNCGKGQPMQAKRLGNGGPTMRSRAIVTGG